MPLSAARKMPAPLGPDSAGARLTPRQFDRAEFEDGWRYELIHGVLVVSPIPSEQESDSNAELGYWLRRYQETNPEGKALDKTLPERIVETGENRRRADRVVWCGLGRLPHKGETPHIIIEFVSAGKRDYQRDYEDKRDEYLAAGVQEYWIIDRFERVMVVYSRQGKRIRKRVTKEKQVYITPLLPGFELLLAVADFRKIRTSGVVLAALARTRRSFQAKSSCAMRPQLLTMDCIAPAPFTHTHPRIRCKWIALRPHPIHTPHNRARSVRGDWANNQ
jgi:Uma2 family endonuclease